MKRIKNPRLKNKVFGIKRYSHMANKKFGSFKVPNRKNPIRLRQDSKMKNNSRKIILKQKGMKYYCASQMQNTISKNNKSRIKVKFNNSTFCNPEQRYRIASKTGLKDKWSKNHKSGFSGKTSQSFSKNNRGGLSNLHNRNKIAKSKRKLKVMSEQNSYSKFNKHVISSKTKKELPRIRMDSLGKDLHINDNYFSVISNEKNKVFSHIPSVISLGTETSLYSEAHNDNNEFNLYCAEDNNLDNNSSGQLDIIYNKKRQNERRIIQTQDSYLKKRVNTSKMFYQGKRYQSKSFKTMEISLKKKNKKKRSFHYKHDN